MSLALSGRPRGIVHLERESFRDDRMPLMSMETVDLSPQVACIRIQGEVDGSNLDRLKAAFEAIFARGLYRVVLNLSKTRYLSSSAIGCVLGGYTSAVKNDGQIVLAGAPLQVTEVLNLIGLGNVLRFAPDEAAALALFAGDA